MDRLTLLKEQHDQNVASKEQEIQKMKDELCRKWEEEKKEVEKQREQIEVLRKEIEEKEEAVKKAASPEIIKSDGSTPLATSDESSGGSLELRLEIFLYMWSDPPPLTCHYRFLFKCKAITGMAGYGRITQNKGSKYLFIFYKLYQLVTTTLRN